MIGSRKMTRRWEGLYIYIFVHTLRESIIPYRYRYQSLNVERSKMQRQLCGDQEVR